MDAPDLIPLFPLPDHVLLLGVPMPYRIFEPRYRAMVDDLLGQPPEQRFLAVPRLAPGWESAAHGAPAFAACAALAVARNIRPLADAQFLMVVEGIQRCRLEERPSGHPYRLAHPEPLPDLPEDPSGIPTALSGLLVQVAMLRERLGKRGEALGLLVADTSDRGALIDRLGAALLGDLGDRQAFLESRSLAQRIALLRSGLDTVLARLHRRGRWDPSKN
jgi:hypothetical protein